MSGTNIKFGENRSVSVKNQVIKKISFLSYIYATTANTAFSGTPVDSSQVIVKIILNRFNNPIEIYNGFLSRIHLATNFKKSISKYFKGTNWKILTAAAGGVKEEAIIPFNVDLGTIVLEGDDELVVSINYPTAAANAQVDTSTSYMEVGFETGEGVEFYTPVYKEYVIQAGETNKQFSLGSKVSSLLLFNSDKDGILQASTPWSVVNLSSDQRTLNYAYRDLLSQRETQFQYLNETDLDQNFQVLEDDSTFDDNVNLQVTFTAANVNASKNYIVAKTFFSNAHQVNKANTRLRKIAGSQIA